MATIKDIARAAGVSPMTVSNVLNERPHVSEATRSKVLATMKNQGYRVNVAARNLRKGRTHTIGLAVPEVDRPYFGQLGAAVIEHGNRHGLHVVIEETGRSRESELSALALSRVRMYDGLILSTVGLGEADVDLLRVDFPVVILGERIFHAPVDHVAMPNAEGARAAVGHLLDQGCTRVAAIFGQMTGEPDMSTLRYEGYLQAHADRRVRPDPQLMVTMDELTPKKASEAVDDLLTRGGRFDGLFCVTDYAAMGAFRALADAGLEIPKDVKVIGYDDVEWSRFSVPSLSSVRPDHDLMAKTAVELLVARISGEGKEPIEFIAPFSLSIRESTASD
ncbi:LacI family DNA-binding transcriptional regulator [Rathayibacter soli]|uniref:LacI family DNA-binding transcriptional regulator n=1 Tax=Rathayibacter soli TaxID=3144168 RepID=UPI0027E5861A|nr:LacI family DNA-binding transcriptional regulator [Glaciibacter superstes]